MRSRSHFDRPPHHQPYRADFPEHPNEEPMTSITINSPEHWHELRAQHVGCSEIAALFGEHQHLTPFELWHIKNGTLPAPYLGDNDRVFWGTTLEPAIAAGAAKLK